MFYVIFLENYKVNTFYLTDYIPSLDSNLLVILFYVLIQC